MFPSNYSVKTQYELRDRDGKLYARGTHEFCLNRLDTIALSDEASNRTKKGWQILPYEIETFGNDERQAE